ncbi:MAG: hypothetical protein QXP81_00320 [Nitrososphaerota archaeon]|nr:hypothetical protein [Candidatus Calditenuis fumarioli]
MAPLFGGRSVEGGMEKVREELEAAGSFKEVFRLVKRVVEEKLGLRRAGLMLVLADAPAYVLAFHGVGTNFIVVNRRVLGALLSSGLPRVRLNSYLFTVLLHEYLHSLGFLDEQEVRRLVAELTREVFGEDHPAYEAALRPLDEMTVRRLMEASHQIGEGEPVLVRDFDDENLTYVA